jgi:hypothetical protein
MIYIATTQPERDAIFLALGINHIRKWMARSDTSVLFVHPYRAISWRPRRPMPSRTTLPIGRRGMIGEPVKMDQRISAKIVGAVDRLSFSQQLRTAHRIN